MASLQHRKHFIYLFLLHILNKCIPRLPNEHPKANLNDAHPARQQSPYRGSCSMWVHIWHLVTTTRQTYLFIFNYKHIWLKMAIIYISNAAFAAFIKKKKKNWIKLEIQHAEITMNILSLCLWQDVQLLKTFTMTFYQIFFLLLSSF